MKYIDDSIALVGRGLRYDPNFSVDEGLDLQKFMTGDDDDDVFQTVEGSAEGNAMVDADVDDDDEQGEDDFGYESDDDDMSWKVRRAAVKCALAIISSR